MEEKLEKYLADILYEIGEERLEEDMVQSTYSFTFANRLYIRAADLGGIMDTQDKLDKSKIWYSEEAAENDARDLIPKVEDFLKKLSEHVPREECREILKDQLELIVERKCPIGDL